MSFCMYTNCTSKLQIFIIIFLVMRYFQCTSAEEATRKTEFKEKNKKSPQRIQKEEREMRNIWTSKPLKKKKT